MLIDECHCFRLRAATPSSWIRLWSSRSRTGTSWRTAPGCRTRWEHTQMLVVAVCSDAIRFRLAWTVKLYTSDSPVIISLLLGPRLSCSCSSLWTLRWPAASSPRSPFGGTSVSSRWCWGCRAPPRRTRSSSAASPRTSPPSPRCVKSPEVRLFLLTSVPVFSFKNHSAPACRARDSFYNMRFVSSSLRSIVLRADSEDVEPVSGVSGPKGPKWRRHQLREDGARSAAGRGRWVAHTAPQSCLLACYGHTSRFKFQDFICRLCLDQQSRPVGNLVQGSLSPQFRNNTIMRKKKYNK